MPHIFAQQPPPKPYNSANSFIEAMNAEQKTGAPSEPAETTMDKFTNAVVANADIVKNSGVRNRVTCMNYPHLFLADGRRADSLRRGPLRAELTRIGVPVLHDMTKIEMLALLAAHNESIGATSETGA
jgi:hypothetical protein